MQILECKDHFGNNFSITPDLFSSAVFHEQGTYLFSLDHTTQFRFMIDEIEILPTPGKLNQWCWQPGFYAGMVEAELQSITDGTTWNYRFDVNPAPTKMGRDSFAMMVEQLIAFDSGLLLGNEPAKFLIGTEDFFEDLHLHYARLRQYGNSLIEAIHVLSTVPVGHLGYDRSRIESHRASRIDRYSITKLSRNPNAVAGLSHDRSRPFYLDVPTSRITFDTAAHRTLCAILKKVLARIRSLIDSLPNLASNERRSSTMTGIAERIPQRLSVLTRLETEFRKILRRTPFRDLGRPEISAAGLNVLAAHPLYARAFRMAWQILRPGIDGATAEEYLSIAPTWQVYERWCFLKIYEALKSAYPEASWTQSRLSKLTDKLIFTGKGGDTKIRLFTQPTFPAYDVRGSSEFYSLSGERCPDMIVTVETTSSRFFLVIDAKYRVARTSVLDAMSSAHLYKDCLRWSGKAPDKSILSIPAPGGAPWLESEEFRSAHSIGVIPIGPETSWPNLQALVRPQCSY